MSAERTNCDVCNSSLERGHASILDAKGNILRCRCFNCANAEVCAEYDRTKVLTSSLVTEASIDDVMAMQPRHQKNYTTDRVMASVRRIEDAIAKFEREVWFDGGLERLTAKAKTKGMSAKRDDFSMLTFTMCGRARVTLQRNDGTHVTMQGLEESSKTCHPGEEHWPGPKRGELSFGLHGICATEGEAIQLIWAACRYWKDGMRVEEDRNVSVI